MGLIEALEALLGPEQILVGAAAQSHATDWMKQYRGKPLAVARPASREEVSGILRLAAQHGVPVVPIGGNTGLVGGTMTRGEVLLSLERMNRIREIRADSRIVIAEAGVVLQRIHEVAEAEGLYFPLWFGARGSATLGGALSTNAGGSNVLRYGSTRALCLGLEVVLADGRVLDLMSELHKDNSGLDLKQLFIGAEGVLGVVTAAVMKLVPAPLAHATAMIACDRLEHALEVLERLSRASGGRVEACEFMPEGYMRHLGRIRPDLGQPFAEVPPVSVLVELATTAPGEAAPGPDGKLPVVALLEAELASAFEAGLIRDAVIAGSEAQRMRIWARREAAAELAADLVPRVANDICLPLDRIAAFLPEVALRLRAVDPGVEILVVAHLGDGNIHLTLGPTREDAALDDTLMRVVEELVAQMGGSFSAEHGIGLTKLPSMLRHKDPVALEVMRAVKAALDPAGLMNPGKVIPPAG